METRKNIIEIIKKYWPILIINIIFLLLGFIYVSKSARNIVFMDFWRNSVNLIPKVKSGELSLRDLWNSSTGGQRNLLQMMIFAANILYFNLNCLWESYGGIAIIAISSIVIYIIWSGMIPKLREYIKTILFLPIILALFNLNQWEILSLEFSLAFMIRILVFIIIFKLTDEAIRNNEHTLKKFLCSGVIAGIAICTLSQLYYPAMLMSIFVVVILATIITPNQTNWMFYLKGFGVFAIPCVFAIGIYVWNLPVGGMGGSLSLFFEMLINGNFFAGIMYMLVGSIVPQTIISAMNSMQVIELGILFCVIILAALTIYIYTQMYKKTFFPILLVCYGLISIPIIIYGRASESDLFNLTASRYSCETTLIWVGCLFIFLLTILNKGKLIHRIVSGVCVFAILCFILLSDVTEWHISKYRGYYKDELIQILEDPMVEELSDSDLVGFQAPAETVKQGIKLMKLYNLNIYAKD